MRMSGLLKCAQVPPDMPGNTPIIPPGTTVHHSPWRAGFGGLALGAVGGLGWAGVAELKRRLNGKKSIGSRGALKRILLGSLGGAGVGALSATAMNQRTGDANLTYDDIAFRQDLLRQHELAQHEQLRKGGQAADYFTQKNYRAHQERLLHPNWLARNLSGISAEDRTRMAGRSFEEWRDTMQRAQQVGEAAKVMAAGPKQIATLGVMMMPPLAPLAYPALADHAANSAANVLKHRTYALDQKKDPSLQGSAAQNQRAAEGNAVSFAGQTLMAIPHPLPRTLGLLTAVVGDSVAGTSGADPSSPLPYNPAREARDVETEQMKVVRQLENPTGMGRLTLMSRMQQAAKQPDKQVAAKPALTPLSRNLLIGGGVAAGTLGALALIRKLRQRKSQQKQAQSVFDQTPGMSPTLDDLYRAIAQDQSLDPGQKDVFLSQVTSAAGNTPGSTPLRELMFKGMGGIIGWLMSKYFGAGAVGQVMGALAGMGVGGMLSHPKPPGVHRGYVNLWETS